MRDTARASWAGWCVERMLRAALVAVILTVLMATVARAQSASTDSAAIYEKQARDDNDGSGEGTGKNKLRDARRALTLYEQQGDTAGQARATILIAETYDGPRIDSLIHISRRAIALLRHPTADSSVLAEAVGLLAYGLLMSRAPLDSAAHSRQENLRLRRLYPDSKKEGLELLAYGDAFLRRASVDSASFGNLSPIDSARRYLYAAVTAARRAGRTPLQYRARFETRFK